MSPDLLFGFVFFLFFFFNLYIILIPARKYIRINTIHFVFNILKIAEHHDIYLSHNIL